jgi:hypothetical protein
MHGPGEIWFLLDHYKGGSNLPSRSLVDDLGLSRFDARLDGVSLIGRY